MVISTNNYSGDNNMKKLLLLCIIFILNISTVCAEETKSTVEIDVYIGKIENFKPATCNMVLYDKNFNQVAKSELEINTIDVTKTLVFEVGEYVVGKEFYLSYLNDADCIKYLDEYYGIGSMILFNTQEEVSMTIYPVEQQRIKFSHNFREYKTEHPLAFIDGNCMISLVDVMNMFNLWENKTVFDGETGRLEIMVDDKNVVMTLSKLEAYSGDDVILPVAPTRINTLMYVPLRFTCEALGADVLATYQGDELNVDVITTQSLFGEKEEYLNSISMSSKTNYLIWIDKSEFSVTLFKGEKNNWKATASYPCSIGAPNTPTITGTFEYYSKEKRWSYPKYYCGPVMRFYGGYAIHSTLVKYDGTFYDGRLGKKISLGCIRMNPDDIQYLWDNIPLYTRIYVTE